MLIMAHLSCINTWRILYCFADCRQGRAATLRTPPMQVQLGKILIPQRVCCALQSAMPVQHAEVTEQAQENTPPKKN